MCSNVPVKIARVLFCISPWNINLISRRGRHCHCVALLMSSDSHLMYNGCRIYERRTRVEVLGLRKFFYRNDSSLMSIPKYFSPRRSRNVLFHDTFQSSITFHSSDYNGFYVVSSDSFIDSRGIPCTRNDNDFLPSYVRSRRLSVRLLFRFSDWRFSSITPRDRASAIGCVQKMQFSSMTLFIYFFQTHTCANCSRSNIDLLAKKE